MANKVIDCMDCKHCDWSRYNDEATCGKDRTLHVNMESVDCDCDGRRPHGGSFVEVKSIYPTGDDCEIGEVI